jgi:hypothetical protein
MAGRDGRCPHCNTAVRAPVSQVPTPPPVAPPQKPPIALDHTPGASPLKTAVMILAALFLGVLLCAGVVAGAVWWYAVRIDRALSGQSLETSDGANQELIDAGKTGVNSDASNNIATRAHGILKKNCYRCHGEGGAAEGGFNYVLQRDKLVEESFISPGSPTDSLLLERVKDGEMPPEGDDPRPTAEEIAVLHEWIEQGAPNFTTPLARTFVSNEQLFELMRSDIEKTNARDRRFLRYFSFVHLQNAGISDDELATYRLALSKLINSLSRNRTIIKPVSVDSAGNLLRLDLRDVKWNSDIWKKLTDATPYAVVFDFPQATAVYDATGTKIPMLRGDWFVAAASRPPLYHDVLQIPATLNELLVELGVDMKRNIAEDRVVRAGFNNSGVSQNNRLIERHDFRDGAVWISYDFAENTGRRNLFSHPLGPGVEDKFFLHDGGEIIFNLPNRLQAYMLVDGAGKRIDKGPTNIVSDKRRPDRQVTNGISCMSCHYAGIITKADEVRAHVLANRSGFAADEEDILALYKDNQDVINLQTQDASRFQDAIRQVGVERLTETNEPIVNMAIRFESNLDLALTAAELGLTATDFARGLPAHPELARVLGVVNSGGALKRDVFVKVFRDAIRAFDIGTPVSQVDTPTPTEDNVVAAPPPAQNGQDSAGSTPPATENANANGMRVWTDITGRFQVQATFEGFNGRVVRLRKQDERIVAVNFGSLSADDQKFVLDQPPDATLDLPPGMGEGEPIADNDEALTPNGTEPEQQASSKPLYADEDDYGSSEDNGRTRRGPILREPPPLEYADALPRVWTPSSHDPFIGVFHRLEAGVLRIRLANGIVLSGPVMDMSAKDHAYMREVMGEAAFEEQLRPPPALFGP